MVLEGATMILRTDFLWKGLFKETKKPACLLLGSIVQGGASQPFQRAKSSRVQGHCVYRKQQALRTLSGSWPRPTREAFCSPHRLQSSPELQVGGWQVSTSGPVPGFPLLGLHRISLESLPTRPLTISYAHTSSTVTVASPHCK